jgi:hypothetical protein
MLEPEFSLLFVRPLNRAGIRYVVSGGIAAIIYGEPRLTNDIDFVVFLRDADVVRLHEIFPSPEFHVPSPEVIIAEIARVAKGQFNIIHIASGFKADFYTAGRDDLNALAFRSARKVIYNDEPLTVASPESVIIRKLEYFREGGSEKHLRDIRAILMVSGEMIDHTLLGQLIQQRGLKAQWEKVGV